MPLQDTWYGGAWGEPWKDPYQPDISKPNAITIGGIPGAVGNTSIDPKLYEPIPIPDLPAQPTPSFIDDARVAQLTQQYASPAIRSARNALREALTGRYTNPIQQKFKARGALEGFGEAVERGVAGGRPSAISVAQREAEEAGAYDKRAYDLAWQRALLDYNQKLNLQNMKIRDAIAQKAFEAAMPTATPTRRGGAITGGGGGWKFYGGDSGRNPVTERWERERRADEQRELDRQNAQWLYVEGPGWIDSRRIDPLSIQRWTNEGRILGEYPQPRASKNKAATRMRISDVATGSFTPIDPSAGMGYPFHVPYSPSGRGRENTERVDAFNKKYGFNQPPSRTMTMMDFNEYADKNIRK